MTGSLVIFTILHHLFQFFFKLSRYMTWKLSWATEKKTSGVAFICEKRENSSRLEDAENPSPNVLFSSILTTFPPHFRLAYGPASLSVMSLDSRWIMGETARICHYVAIAKGKYTNSYTNIPRQVHFPQECHQSGIKGNAGLVLRIHPQCRRRHTVCIVV